MKKVNFKKLKQEDSEAEISTEAYIDKVYKNLFSDKRSNSSHRARSEAPYSDP